jgi:hypothetical protein
MPLKPRKVRRIVEKEWIYVGYYIDIDGKFVLKIGTTNDLCRRQSEHTRNYRKAPKHQMPQNEQFKMLWYRPLSKYNTIRYEDRNRDYWKKIGFGEFVRNDRFVFDERPTQAVVRIKKEWVVAINV